MIGRTSSLPVRHSARQLLDQPRFAGLEGAVEIEAAVELLRQIDVLVEKDAIASAGAPSTSAQNSAVFLRHELTGLAVEERGLQRDLRLHIARQELLEFDEAVDESERDLRTEHGVFAAADARVASKMERPDCWMVSGTTSPTSGISSAVWLQTIAMPPRLMS